MVRLVTEMLGWRFLLAVILSATIWARLTLDLNPQRRDIYPTDIPVEIQGLPPGLVVANDSQRVKLRVAAPQESWKHLEPASFRAMVDLSNATAGLVQPEVAVEVSDPQVRVLERLPSTISLRVEELRARSVPVRVNQLGSVPFGYRLVGEPVTNPSTVEVSGPSSAVEKVTEASLSVRMEDIKATIDRSLQPEPRGPSGVVSGARLDPQTVTVTMQVERIAGTKAVSVVPQIKGQPAPGYWQGPITIDPATILVVAEPSLLERVTVLSTADVDIAGAQAEVVKTVPIQRQPGVSLIRDQAATVRVAIQALPGQQVRDATLAIQHLSDGLIATTSPSVVSVALSGPQPTLIRTTSLDVVARIDLAGLPAGVHTLPVSVRTPESLRVDRVTPDLVTVTLTARPPPP